MQKLIIGNPESNEKDLHIHTCNLFLSLGPSRTLKVLHQELTHQFEKSELKVLPSIIQLRSWRKNFKWDDRCNLYDVNLNAYKEFEAYKALSHELAKTWGRTKKLILLAEKLEQEIETKGFWIENVKTTRYGSETVNIFNSALINAYKGTLDDIAKETGGRSNKKISRFEEEPEQDIIEDMIDLEQLTDKELEMFEVLINKLEKGDQKQLLDGD